MAYLNRAITAPRATKSLTSATVTLTAAESGKVLFLNLATGIAVTLPAAAPGLEFEFYVGIAPTGGTSYIIASAAPSIVVGQAYSSTSGNADSQVSVGDDQLNLVVDVAVIGDSATFICDGTTWYVRAFTNADAAATFTT